MKFKFNDQIVTPILLCKFLDRHSVIYHEATITFGVHNTFCTGCKSTGESFG